MLLHFAAIAFSAYPIPNRPTGIIWGTSNPLIVIDLFGDPLCPDCLAAWPTISQVLVKYATNVQIRYHMLPLPYHTWAFVVTRMILAVKSVSEFQARSLVSCLYSGDQSKFQNGDMELKGEKEAIQYIADWASYKAGIDKTTLLAKYALTDISLAARIEFKYAGFHNVAGTPTFFINGVQAPLGAESTVADWQAIIDPMLK